MATVSSWSDVYYRMQCVCSSLLIGLVNKKAGICQTLPRRFCKLGCPRKLDTCADTRRLCSGVNTDLLGLRRGLLHAPGGLLSPSSFSALPMVSIVSQNSQGRWMDEWLAPALDSDGIELGVVCEVSLISHLSESSCSQKSHTAGAETPDRGLTGQMLGWDSM